MRATVAFAFAVAAFAAVLAAPSVPKVSVTKIQLAPVAYHAGALRSQTVVPKSLIGDLIQLIGQIYGLDIAAIRYKAEEVLTTIDTEVTTAIGTIVTAAGAIDDQLAQRYASLLNNAVAEAQRISGPLGEVIQKLLKALDTVLPSSSKRVIAPKDLIDDLLMIIVGMNQQQVEDLVNKTVDELTALADRTILDAKAIAEGVGSDFTAKVEGAITKAETTIQKKLDELEALLAPILGRSVASVANPKDLIGDLIQLIGQLYGLDIAAIVYQAEAVLNTISTEIPLAINTIVTAAGNIDDQLALRYTNLLNNAVAEAERISAPLLQVIDKLLSALGSVLPRAAKEGMSPKDLVDDLLTLIIGMNKQQLEDLAIKTLTDLNALADRTVVEAQAVAVGVGADFATKVNNAVTNAESNIREAIDKLLTLLAPILGKNLLA